MAQSFKTYSAKNTFGVFKEPLDSGQYTYYKKLKYTYCSPNLCHPNKNIGSENNLILLKQANLLKYYSTYPIVFNNYNLYSNLITNLDLSGVSVMSNMITNISPTKINISDEPYLSYNIDPNGNLFGNTICGINNFVDYMVYDSSDINNL
jgi:hypothetical protein